MPIARTRLQTGFSSSRVLETTPKLSNSGATRSANNLGNPGFGVQRKLHVPVVGERGVCCGGPWPIPREGRSPGPASKPSLRRILRSRRKGCKPPDRAPELGRA